MKKIALILAISTVFSLTFFVGCSCKSCNESTLTSYDISIDFDDENMLITGTETVDFYNDTDNAISYLKFNIFPNAFREGAVYKPISDGQVHSAYPNGESFGNMNVSAVFCGEKPLVFAIVGEDENVLKVDLLGEIYPEESVEIKILFSVKLANVLARTGYNENTINLGNFYPILCAYDGANGFKECLYYSYGDPFCSSVANYSVSITLDDEYAVASSGNLVKKDSKNGRSTYAYSLEKVRDFAFVLSSEYEMVTADANGVTVNYYYHSDSTPKKSLDTAVKALTTFENLFCEYPYSTFSVCETGFNEGGMEYPALVMISDEITDDLSYQEVIVHETAHQWWYSLVGNDQIEYGFLDEGLTEYSTVLFFENNPEYGLTRDSLIKIAKTTYSTYCTVYEKVFGNKDTSMLRALPEYTSVYEYVNISYVKGALMFDYLREGLGDELFFKGLKKYIEEYSYSLATPDCLVGSFEKVGANTNGFFKSWFNGEVIL